MSDSISDADKIRNKRLAKLGGAQAGNSQASRPSSDTKASDSDAAAGPSTTTPAPQSPTDPSAPSSSKNASVPDAKESPNPLNPYNPLATMQAKNAPPPKINITSLKRTRPAPGAGGDAAMEEPLDAWEHRTLSAIFRLTLDSGKRQDHAGHKLQYVEGVRQDLEEQSAPLRLSVAVLDQAIPEAAAKMGKTTPFEYLLACWKRVSKHYRALRGKGDEPRLHVVRETRRVCMSYCIFALTMPDMFGLETPEVHALVGPLLLSSDDERGVDHDFLTELIARFSTDDLAEEAQEAIVGAVESLSSQLAEMNMNDDYKPYVLALRNLVRYPALVNVIAQSTLFLLDVHAASFENVTLLGPFFAISPLHTDVASNYFSSPKTKDKSSIMTTQNALRMSLRAHQADLLDIVNHIIKTSKEAREKMLDWFAASVNLNHKRRALQVDQKTVATDGFMVNVTVCLDQLCEPFMDATFSKIDRIDVDYLRRNPRVNIKDETKLNADQNTSDEFYANTADGQSNFISEVFFLALAAHHYGTEAVHSQLSTLERELKHMEKQVADIEADREKFASNPVQLQMVDRALQKYKDHIDRGIARKLCTQGVMLDDLNQARSMQFMRYAIVWLLRLVDPEHAFPKKPLTLPLPEAVPAVFACLPEYFVEDVVANFKFIMRNMPQIITTTQSDEVVVVCITFLRSSEYVKNPYLKAGLVTILFHGTWPAYGRAKGVLGDILNALPFALEHLLHALMRFYIEVEVTGAHTQFYDKFNIRYEIFQIIKCIWATPVYRERLDTEARVNVEFFVRFVNLLLNDVTYVLDESLSALHKIHELQELLAPGSAAGAALEAAQRQEKQEALEDAQHRAKSYMQLANETVAMLKLFTAALAEAFTKPEIVQRLADMLDYNLDAMVGPRSSQLKVKGPEEYGFNPRVLLAELVDVYLNLAERERFVLAVARDGRSYKPANLDTATRILERYALKSREELARWRQLGRRFARAKELDAQAEEDLGEVPDEFLDPLMYTLMEDPVVLPTSRTTVDRATIRSHLLSDPNDPFNRMPLKIEEVVANTELKAQIEAFKAERKGNKLDMADIMDTSTG